jgi:hypothetical protein
LIVQATLTGYTQTWSLNNTIKASCFSVKVDQLGSIYGIRKGEIIKWDKNGELLTRYSNKLIGEDIQLDVTNPMKVILFSPEQMRLVFLDSRLGELREEINLFKEGFEQISLAATSHSNGLWVYDPINFILVRYDQYLVRERTSLNLAQMLRLNLYPTALIEVNNKVYLSDPEHGIFVFDIFGNYLKKIPIKGINQLSIADDRLFYVDQQKIKALNLIDFNDELVEIAIENHIAYDIGHNVIVLVEAGKLLIFNSGQ